jgi:hypothetical protein
MGRVELFAGGGVARVGGDEGSLGNGPYLTGGIGFGLGPRASIELDVMKARHDRTIAGGPLEGTATGIFGSVLYHFSNGRTRPFVLGSVGLLRSDVTQTFPVNGTPTVFTSRDSNFAWGGGGGAKILLTSRLSLRPQLRLVFSESTGVMGLVAPSIGAEYRW